MLNVYTYSSARGQLKKGVQYGPDEIINRLKYNYRMNIIEPFEYKGPRDSNKLNYDEVSDDCYKLYQSIMTNKHDKPLFLGGDHTIAIGTISAMLDKYPDLFVIWVDAHCDINTSQISLSHNIHGMPVAQISDLEPKYKFKWIKNHLNLDRLIYVGIRDVDPDEAMIMVEKKIKYVTVDRIKEDGINETVKNIKKIINGAPVHISLDVDGIDPKYVPSTGTPVNGGLELDDVVHLIKNMDNIKSMDITEFNPLIGNNEDKKKSLDSIMELANAYINIKN